jgi:hypothetical protein
MYCRGNPVKYSDPSGYDSVLTRQMPARTFVTAAAVGAFLGYHALTYGERVVAQMKGVPGEQINQALSQIPDDCPQKQVMANILQDYKGGLYSKYTNARCFKAAFEFKNELIKNHSAEGIQIGFDTQKGSVGGIPQDINYCTVTIPYKDQNITTRFYLGSDRSRPTVSTDAWK